MTPPAPPAPPLVLGLQGRGEDKGCADGDGPADGNIAGVAGGVLLTAQVGKVGG